MAVGLSLNPGGSENAETRIKGVEALQIGGYGCRDTGMQGEESQSANDVYRAGAEVRGEEEVEQDRKAEPEGEGEGEEAETDTIPRRTRRARAKVWDYFACEGFKDYVPEIVEEKRRRKPAANGKDLDVNFTAEEVAADGGVVLETEEDITTASEAEESNEELSVVDEEQFDGFELGLEA